MPSPEQPHLVSLVLQSKKALQHGEQLCSRANVASNASAQCVVDVLALDAKVRWLTDAVLAQLKLAASVAKSIDEKRAQLTRQIQDWDALRVQRADALDKILESLGSQVVPPDFHQASSGSSLFGSQHSDHEVKANGQAIPSTSPFQQSPSATLRNDRLGREINSTPDRTNWKTLRDFVDDRAIDEALESMDNDRNALDDILAATDDYPETLSYTISAIQNTLPVALPPLSVMDALNSQATISTTMAHHLDSLTAHYDQMAGALRESEAGEAFSEEDLQEMNRDTDELPSIMAELEESNKLIETSHQQLLSVRDATQKHLDAHQSTLDDLDELGEIMTDMLTRQAMVEIDCEEHMTLLHQHLVTLEDLHQRFLAYQASFNKLIVEIARRRQYREAAENIVKGMHSQLEAMTEEERQVRNIFHAEHGAHLPADICLCIENPPTRWEVVPHSGDTPEALPDIEDDILVQAQNRLVGAEGVTESMLGI